MECDVLILGAGPAGTTAARYIAEKGINVILVEQNKKEDVGKKVCGDGLTSKALNLVNLKPTKDFALQHISKLRLISPDKKTDMLLQFGQRDGYCIDRKAFAQVLLKKAEEAGAKIIYQSTAQELIWKEDKISGAIVNGNEIKAKIVITATGMSGFRLKTPAAKKLTKEDVYVCYRERALVENPNKEGENIYIFLNQKIAPGGYIWYFPMGVRDNKLLVNFGLGIQGSNEILKTNKLQSLLDEFKKQNPELFKDYEIYKKDPFNERGGIVPIRYVLESLADIKNNEPTGLLYAGDVGATVDPIHGGGIRYSMESGVCLSEPVIEFIKTGEYAKLWDYNKNYIKRLGGKKQGPEYVASRAMQTASNRELDLLLDIVFEDTDFEELISGNHYNFEKAKLLGKLARLALSGQEGRKALHRLFWAYLFAKKIKKVYAEYPDTPKGLDTWSNQLHKTLDEYKEKLSKI